ncbi:MAG TPA: beta-ketoacyl synthase N-terminal-like domain-containing protein, partial [Vicinamibacteria bacterium]
MSAPPEAPLAHDTPALSPLKRAFLALEEMKAKLDALEQARREPIAIVGMGCRFPGGADTPEAFWQLLRAGTHAVGEVPKERFDVDALFDADPDAPGRVYARWGAFVRDIDRFDPQHFGIAPREAASLDPQQRLLLEVSWEALEHAGQAPDGLAGSRTGVFVGICSVDYMVLGMRSGQAAATDAYALSGLAHSMASGRLSYVLGLQGPSLSVDTACSSSLVAVHLACESLRAGASRMALAAGVHAMLAPDNMLSYCRSRMLAFDGRCKTFAAGADGFVEGEGCGVVVLKRLCDALADGDRVLAVIRGSAVNQDGPSSGLTAPNGPAQEAVLREALERAGLTPAAVGYVEAHGTGTSLGDPIEVQALGAVLGAGRAADDPVRIGSVKTNLGHLQAAAGVAGLIKLVLSLQHREIPPHLHFEAPNPHVPWPRLPVTVPTELTPWSSPHGPRIGGVSAFGFSGTNAHVLVEEAPAAAPRAGGAERSHHLLAVSGRTEAALRDALARWAAHLGGAEDAPLRDLAFTANVGRAHLAHRAVVVAGTAGDAVEKLAALAAGETPAGTSRGYVTGSERPKVAFLFTGQGAQYAGMGRQLFTSQPTFRRALERCDEALRPHLAPPLLEVLFAEAEASPLQDTACTQPALFALEWALAELWRSWGVVPAAVMGHSVGEYVAACVAGVLSLEDALALVAARGRLMGALPAGGGMWAVAAGEERVREAIAAAGGALALAAVNGPEDVVLSGDAAAAEPVVRGLEASGARVKRLAVSHAFHSPLMDPVLDAFERVAGGVAFAAPRRAIVSNLTGAVAREELTQAAYWRRHLREPVRFADGMAALHRLGCRTFLEIGPHPALLGPARACVPEGAAWLPSLRRGRDEWPQMLESLSELHVRGVEVDWAGFDRDYARRKVVAPRYPFQRERCWYPEAPVAAPPVLAPAPRRGGHPLLGQRVRSAAAALVFESRLGTAAPAYLADHRKYGTAVLPATACLEMGLAAAAAHWGPGAHAFEDLVVSDPLAFAGDQARTVQVVVTPEGASAASFQLFSLRGEGGDGASWRLHATGTLRAADAPAAPAAEAPDTVQARCAAIPAGEYYERMAGDGHEYGPSFRGIVELRRGEGEALAHVRLAGDAGTAEGYLLHPALLDAALQVVGVALPDARPARDGETYLPASLDRYRLLRPGATALWAHARLRASEADGASFTCDVRLASEAGEVVAEVEGLRFARTRADAIRRANAPSVGEWLYQVEWRRQEAASAAAPADLSGTWLLLADRGGVAAELSRRLAAAGAHPIVVAPAGTPLEGTVPVRPETAAEFDALCAPATGPLRGVVHLWSLDRARDEPGEHAAALCAGLLHLVQAVGRSGQAPRLFVVTRGARPLDPLPAASVPQAALLGLSRTIAAEHPELRCTTVDLGPAASPADADALWAEIAQPGGEDQGALRPYGRHAARLVRSGAASARAESADRAVDLEIATPGVLDRLRFVPLARQAPGPGQVEIRVEASGLNFRDVLMALDMYPG